MSGGKKFEYHWRDNIHYKKPTPLPAPKYVDELMDWVDAQINDPSLFPTDIGRVFHTSRDYTDIPFPKCYISTVKKIFSRLFRVFVHVYIHHFDRLHEIGAVCSFPFNHYF